MRARAQIVAEADGRGGTRLAVLHGESPLLMRRTGVATVHLVGGAAGPLRGDDLRLDIEVGPGARLTMRSVAAALALPGRDGPPSRLEIRAVVAEGAELCWRPEPLIAAAGCDHHAVAEVTVADGGRLLWRDDLVCGRHGEESGAVRADIAVRYAGVTLYRHQLRVGPGAPGWSGPAVLGGGGAAGSVVLAGADLPSPRILGTDAALMALAGPGMLATAVGADIRAIRAALDDVVLPPAAGDGRRPPRSGEPEAESAAPHPEPVS